MCSNETNQAQTALIAFGANLGTTNKNFDACFEAIDGLPDVELIAASNPITTKAVDGRSRVNDEPPDYLNAVVRVTTVLNANELHKILIDIETSFGRERRRRWGSRTIDLDLLLFGDQIIDEPQLTVPHPRMTFRRFVLEPANEIACDLVHPLSGLSIEQLLHRINQPINDFLVACHRDSVKNWHNILQRAGFAKTSQNVLAVSTPDAFTCEQLQAKLLVFDSDELPEELAGAAIRFRGPTLNLKNQTPESRVIELNAAVDAMADRSQIDE